MKQKKHIYQATEGYDAVVTGIDWVTLTAAIG